MTSAVAPSSSTVSPAPSRRPIRLTRRPESVSTSGDSRLRLTSRLRRSKGTEPFTRYTPGLSCSTSGASESNSSCTAPTICSTTFSIVTMPTTEPYSSSTSAMCWWVFCISCISWLIGMVSGTWQSSRETDLRSRSSSAAKPSRSLMCTSPTTSSRDPSHRGKRVWRDSRASSKHSEAGLRTSKNTTSRRGTMTCRVSMSSKRNTALRSSSSEGVSSPDCPPSSMLA